MTTSGVPRATNSEMTRAVGQVLSVDLDYQDCVVKVGPSVLDGVTWWGDPPAVGAIVTLIQSGTRMLIQGGSAAGSGGGGSGSGGGGVQEVIPGIGITVSGQWDRPTVSANKAELGEWFPDKDVVYGSLEWLDARIDAIQNAFQYAGTYNAALRVISNVAAEMVDAFPLPPPAGYAIGASLVQVPAQAWNKRHFLIVSHEGPVVPGASDGVDEITGSPATFMRVGDWIISDGEAWVHLTYSARALLASSIVYEGPNSVTADTVQEALDKLFTDLAGKAPAHSHPYVLKTGDTMSGRLQMDTAQGITLHYPGNSVVSIGSQLLDGRYHLEVTDSWSAEAGSYAPVRIGSPTGSEDAARVDWSRSKWERPLISGPHGPLAHYNTIQHVSGSGPTVFDTALHHTCRVAGISRVTIACYTHIRNVNAFSRASLSAFVYPWGRWHDGTPFAWTNNLTMAQGRHTETKQAGITSGDYGYQAQYMEAWFVNRPGARCSLGMCGVVDNPYDGGVYAQMGYMRVTVVSFPYATFGADDSPAWAGP